jgi:hypothetical protein
VAIIEDGVPWPIVLHFVQFTNDDGTIEWLNTAFELRRGVDVVTETPRENVPEVAAATLERIALNYSRYLRLARADLGFWVEGGDLEAIVRETEVLRRLGQGRQGLNDEFYRRIAAEYEAEVVRRKHGAITRLANAHQVDRATASRWITKAKTDGYIKEEKK